MKRLLIIISAIAGMMLAGTVAVAQSDDVDLPEHPHLLIQRPEIGLIEGVPHVVNVRKCVDLANNRALPLNSHHQHLHQGTAGVMLFERAGHVVVPAKPLPGVLWEDCDDFLDMLPIPVPSGD